VSYQGFNGCFDEGVEIENSGYRIHEYRGGADETYGPIKTQTVLVEDHPGQYHKWLEANKVRDHRSSLNSHDDHRADGSLELRQEAKTSTFADGDQGPSKRKASSPPRDDNGASAQPPPKSPRKGGCGGPHRPNRGSPGSGPPDGGSPHHPFPSEEEDPTLARLLGGFRPPLRHLVRPLRSIGVTNVEYLVAVARMRNATAAADRQGYNEVRQAALSCGITVADWAILIQCVLHALQVVPFPYS
jgi:hypothetical protein